MVRRSRHNSHKAFTLVELLVVVAIIAVLLGILLPTIAGVRLAARKASTQSLMRNVRVAIDAFQADNGRAPGFFSPFDMGRQANGDTTPRGFTAMENAILELALPPDAVRTIDESGSTSPPGANNTVIDIGPFGSALAGQNVRINIAEIGTSASGSYLSVGQDHFRPVEGQVSAPPLNDLDGERIVDGRLIGMPDIIDYFGQPIMLWQRDTGANPVPVEYDQAPAMGDAFGAIFNEDASGQDGKKASFYWASNAGYLMAGADAATMANVGDFDDRPGLGRDRVNQFLLSCIGGALKNSEPLWVAESLMGALGAPAFPTEPAAGQLPLPARARGEIILHSSGPDKIYLERARTITGVSTSGEETTDRVGYAPREAVKTTPPLFRTPDDFDDLFEATGG